LIGEDSGTTMNIIDLQRRKPGPRADELLAGLQAAVATDERVRWKETGHARLRVGQELDDARITVAARLTELGDDCRFIFAPLDGRLPRSPGLPGVFSLIAGDAASSPSCSSAAEHALATIVAGPAGAGGSAVVRARVRLTPRATRPNARRSGDDNPGVLQSTGSSATAHDRRARPRREGG
jgi:hypothetical protein